MNNPDERTAVDQFGDNDKYFGVCTLLATLPGLPMIGHGQIEGFTEKYGMEYRRAYYDESPRDGLVDRHRREIFPLFRKRALFAEAARFLLYDFFTPDGPVDENVFAYSNGTDGDRALVVFHNTYAETRGWIRTSAAFARKTGAGDEKVLVQKTLAEGLNLPDDPAAWVVFKDMVTGLEYIRNARTLARKGFYLELAAYKYAVFTDFRVVRDDERRLYSRIAVELSGGGVVGLEQAAIDFWLRPVQAAFRELVNPGFFEWLMTKRIFKRGKPLDPEAGRQAGQKARRLAEAVARLPGGKSGGNAPGPGGAPEADEIAAAARRDFEAILRLPVIEKRGRTPGSKTHQNAMRYLKSGLTGRLFAGKAAGKTRRPTRAKPYASRLEAGIDPGAAWVSLFCWAAVRAVGRLAGGRNPADRLDEWGLERIIDEAWRDSGCAGAGRAEVPGIIRALAGHPEEFDPNLSAGQNARRLAGTIVGEARFRRALGINQFEGIEYFNQEAFDAMRWLLVAVEALRSHGVGLTAAGRAPVSGQTKITSRAARMISRAFALSDILRRAERKSGFETAKLLAVLNK